VRSPSPSTEVVARFWDALYARDWAGIKAALRADSVYWDVPTGPTTAAQGPDAIEARLRLGLDTLSGYDHGPATIVADGPVVMTEHAETCYWESGESVALPFVSVQRVDGPHIVVWRDYWDYRTLWDAAPQVWHDRLMTADLWWLHDATGVT